MKKSLHAVFVILLSLIGANAWASAFDLNVERIAKETVDKTGSQNGNSGNGDGGRNLISREK